MLLEVIVRKQFLFFFYNLIWLDSKVKKGTFPYPKTPDAAADVAMPPITHLSYAVTW
jgi:hypothetical protein